MNDLPKTQTVICKACGIVHSPRHWADEAKQHCTPAATTAASNKSPKTHQQHKKHELWEDKAGQFIKQFSRSKTAPVFVASSEAEEEEKKKHVERTPAPLLRRSTSLSRRDSSLDMGDGVIDFRDEDGRFAGEWDHVVLKKKGKTLA
ncbi:uncharacterized protein HMPREF1541_01267 [Cyphellophora europaea CBS 101466]|uniref:Uncharacterized protein n=1 Tax=Cyphellophora europaea (strain CBS 101466) TaxID=1220924 RepID=W2SEF7_CYPE1|nr:uncharacterized protein HMPREF1541_01267 [Cyphellophora europaea CBS 101466]ETN47077.1 hypothetical protein HMPREF1541_01267 [Cyphellophora europaea CBS 101466]